MKQNEKIVGKTLTHNQLGKVKVLKSVPKSRTKVEVEVVGKGEGWNPKRNRFTGIATENGWHRGENKEWGKVDIVNIKDLT